MRQIFFHVRRVLGLCRNRKLPARRTLQAVATNPITFDPASCGKSG